MDKVPTITIPSALFLIFCMKEQKLWLCVRCLKLMRLIRLKLSEAFWKKARIKNVGSDNESE